MKISIIVPVYNVENYLSRCIESILNQTFKEFELLLIDDGSTDNSSKICDQYQIKNSCIKVFHKKNGGLSDARNYGIKNAEGDYIAFIDSDDYISVDYLSTLIKLIETNGCDVAVGRLECVCSKTMRFIESGFDYEVLDGPSTFKELLLGTKMSSNACALLVKKEIAQKNLFPVGKYHEDDLTTYKYYFSANKVAISQHIIYYYYQRENSIMHSFGKQVLDEIDATENFVNVAQKYGNDIIEASKQRKFRLYSKIIIDYPSLKNIYKQKYIELGNYLMENKKLILKNNHSLKINKKYAMEMCFGIKFFEYFNRFFIKLKVLIKTTIKIFALNR